MAYRYYEQGLDDLLLRHWGLVAASPSPPPHTGYEILRTDGSWDP